MSVVVPTFNMARYLPGLWVSVVQSGLVNLIEELIFVNDGSNDDTERVIQDLQKTSSKVRVLTLTPNRGRFEARRLGAEAATSEWTLFLDSRLTVTSELAAGLASLPDTPSAFMGCVDIDTSKDVFALYWDRSHRLLFSRHFRDTKQPLLLTEQNYDRYLKGTGMFLCRRAVFLEACRRFAVAPPLNDDTFLLKEMVRLSPILIHPNIRIQWVPRDNAKGFLLRLWERGPSFVEYHVCAHRGGFFWTVLVGCLVLLGWLVCLLTMPWLGLGLLLGLGGLIALSTLLLSTKPHEFVRLLPLHVAVVGTFGCAILRGLAVNLIRGVSSRAKGASPVAP